MTPSMSSIVKALKPLASRVKFLPNTSKLTVRNENAQTFSREIHVSDAIQDLGALPLCVISHIRST